MAQFIPKINLPVEGVAHARWLEDRAKEQITFNAEVRAFMARAGRASSAGARQTTVINNKVRASEGGRGLPAGGTTGQRLAKLSERDFHADWVENTVGGMVQSYYDVDADGGSTNLYYEYEGKLLEVNMTSAAPNSPYTVRLPNLFNFERDLQQPFYILSLNTYGDSVDLTLQGDVPIYHDHRSVFIMGMAVTSGEGTITLPADFKGQWFVIPNNSGNNSVAIPLNDTFYDGSFGAPLGVSADVPSFTPTAAAGTGPSASIAGTSSSGELELVTGTSPTTTGWGELFTFTAAAWASGEVPAVQLYPANQAAAGLKHYVNRSGVDAEVFFDLTGLAASTSYKFNYHILPFTA